MDGFGQRRRQLQPFERIGSEVFCDADRGRPRQPQRRAAGPELREFAGEQIANEPVQRAPVVPPSCYGFVTRARYDASTAFICDLLRDIRAVDPWDGLGARDAEILDLDETAFTTAAFRTFAVHRHRAGARS
jgi:hypothetical protein